MKFNPLSLLALPLAFGKVLPGRNRRFNQFDGLPANGLQTNGVAIGFLPSDGNETEGVSPPRITMADINQRLGAVASTVGLYSHINSQNYDGYELLGQIDDVVNSGAVFVASVMPVLQAGFTAITPNVASQVAAVLRQFTDRGVEVWLRYGHEMNYYVEPSASPNYFGTPAEFITSFQNVAAAVKNNSLISMFWSPNNIGNGDASVLDQWYPGDESADIVGIDCYPDNSGQTFDYFYQNFYQRFSAAKNKPFVIGESGATGSLREPWLKQLVSQDQSAYPLYKSMSWFEYYKGADFRIVMSDDTTLAETKQTLGLD